MLDLAFDVDFLERRDARSLEETASLASQERDVFRSILQKVLALVVNDELRGISVGLKAEFLRDETQLHIRFVPRVNVSIVTQDVERINLRSANVAHSSKTFPHDKHIHEVCSHVRGVHVQLEESVIVAQSKRGAHVQSMPDRSLLLLCAG